MPAGTVAEPKYDLFVSYSDADRGWVEHYLLDALSSSGLTSHTEAAFELGVPRITEFERAVQQSKRTLLILSPAYLVDDTRVFIDLLAETYGFDTATWPVIPLLLRPVEREKIPLRLRVLTSLDATDEKNWESVIERLTEALGQPPPGPTPKPPPPYPGMRTFREEESNLFYGREADTNNLLQLLRAYPFLALIGPSGSGKSSLVYAGLIPKLRRSSAFGPGEWLVRDLRPGENPMKALSDELGGDPSQSEAVVSTLLSRHPNAQRLLLVIDQFEEVFTVAKGDTASFQESLRRLAGLPGTYVILTARADFYSELTTAPLWPDIQKHRYEVLPLDEDGLAQAILKPAEDVGVYVESALVERLVADAGGEPGILPFVQETMILLWDKVERRYLPLSAYEALVLPRRAYGRRGPGKLTGLQVAIALRADATLDGLWDERQDAIARRIFVRLVQFGEGRPDTRRQQPVHRLRTTADDPGLFDLTLTYLADEKHRLLTLSGYEHDPGRKVDIAHEALISAWPTLQGWLDEWRAAELLRRQIENDVLQWSEAKGNSFYLYQGTRLEQAQAWAASYEGELDKELQTFLGASRGAGGPGRALRQGCHSLPLRVESWGPDRVRPPCGRISLAGGHALRLERLAGPDGHLWG